MIVTLEKNVKRKTIEIGIQIFVWLVKRPLYSINKKTQ
jgi:hypothetical protein